MKKRFIAVLVIVFLLILPSTLQAKSSDTNINYNKLKGYTYYTNNSSISNENTIYVKYYTDDIVKFQIKDDYVIVKLKDVEDNIRYKFDILENRGMSLEELVYHNQIFTGLIIYEEKPMGFIAGKNIPDYKTLTNDMSELGILNNVEPLGVEPDPGSSDPNHRVHASNTNIALQVVGSKYLTPGGGNWTYNFRLWLKNVIDDPINTVKRAEVHVKPTGYLQNATEHYPLDYTEYVSVAIGYDNLGVTVAFPVSGCEYTYGPYDSSWEVFGNWSIGSKLWTGSSEDETGFAFNQDIRMASQATTSQRVNYEGKITYAIYHDIYGLLYYTKSHSTYFYIYPY